MEDVRCIYNIILGRRVVQICTVARPLGICVVWLYVWWICVVPNHSLASGAGPSGGAPTQFPDIPSTPFIVAVCDAPMSISGSGTV